MAMWQNGIQTLNDIINSEYATLSNDFSQGFTLTIIPSSSKLDQ